ncbi:MAG: PEP-CTERM sorting domain-containing protein [Pseudomonadota bacterium]
MLKKLLIGLNLMGLSLPLFANPGILTPKVAFFTDRDAWIAASYNSYHQENLENATPYLGATFDGATKGLAFASGFKYEKYTDFSDPSLLSSSNGAISDTLGAPTKSLFALLNTGDSRGIGANFDLSPNGAESGINLIVYGERSADAYIIHNPIPSTANGQFFGVITSFPVTSFRLWSQSLFRERTTQESFTMSSILVASPTPEPETYAMLLLGLGSIGYVKRKKLLAMRMEKKH